MSRLAPILSVACLLIMCGTALAQAATPSVPSGPSASQPTAILTSEDMANLAIYSATDIPSGLTLVAPQGNSPRISRQAAISIASAVLFRSDYARVLHGSAPRNYGEAAGSVWIVLYRGGELTVPDPDVLDQILALRFTGVIIDDFTGEVLRWFTC